MLVWVAFSSLPPMRPAPDKAVVASRPLCEESIPLYLPHTDRKVRIAQVIYSDGSMMMPAYGKGE